MMLMADLLENAQPDKQVEFISNIRVGLHHTEWLVSALLKMAKLDAGAVAFTHENVTTASLIELATEPLQIQFELKNQHLEVMGEATLDCDKRWTAEALSNVIKNASEHSPENSAVRIMIGENPICVWINVTDSGNGLTTAQIAKLFRRFEGAQGSKGYGIGLPLALSIMRGQDGDIEVDGGGNGTGATFSLKLFK
jgi:signal transduction histidine kinase